MSDYLTVNENCGIHTASRLQEQVGPRIASTIRTDYSEFTWVNIGHRNSRQRLNAWILQFTKGKICYDYGMIGFKDDAEAMLFQLGFVNEW